LHTPAPSQAPATNQPPPPPPPLNSSVMTAPLFSSTGYGAPAPAVNPAMSPVRQIDLLSPDAESSAKNRTTFLLLGALLGWAGAHSLYAGSTKKGLIQAGITAITLGLAGLMVWIWAIIDICTITTDSDGVPFRN